MFWKGRSNHWMTKIYHSQVNSLNEVLSELWATVQTKVERMIDQIGDKTPHVAHPDSGRYDDTDIDWWTSGFWPGMLWIMHDMTGKENFKEAAWSWDEKLERKMLEDNRFHHDVGFQYLPTAVIKYTLTGDRAARRRGLSAANYLAGRFNLAGSFLRAWNTPEQREAWNYDNIGWAIVDSCMNLSLLFWASQELQDPRFTHIARAHADTVIRDFICEDGSVHHIVSYDPMTGEKLGSIGGQGAAPDSAWSRGMAWALHGMANTYRYTGDMRYLRAAQRVAHYFLAMLPDDSVPYWDYRASDDMKDEPRDTSAASCAASGLLEIADALPKLQGEPYRQAAQRILLSLTQHYGTWERSEHEAILTGATGHKPANTNINVSLIYGDYFYVEALAKLMGWRHRIF